MLFFSWDNSLRRARREALTEVVAGYPQEGIAGWVNDVRAGTEHRQK
jgi:hypothetical protein